MIGSFRHKGLEAFWQKGTKAGIDVKLENRIRARLLALLAAIRPEDMRLPGFDFHPLKGDQARRYSVHVNGPWCITFDWIGTDAVDVDLENYH